MKRFGKIAIVMLMIAFCLTATSCLSLLSSAIEVVYNSAFDTDTLEREIVTEHENKLGVTFEDGTMYATWDASDAYTYELTVKSAYGTHTYDADDEGFAAGKVDLSALGYAYNQNLTLTLKKTQTNSVYSRSTSVGYSYAKLSADDYAKYTKKVKAGFSEIDYYMGSRAEFFDFWSYLLIFREGSTFEDGCYELESKVYMGYDYASLYSTNKTDKAFAYEVYSAIDAYEDSAAYTYTFDVDSTGKYGTIYLKFTYDNNPKYTSDSCETYRNGEKTSDRAHYSYKEDNDRTFAIDTNAKGTISVSASDQLYFAMKKGYRPAPVKNSNAEYLYDEMRRILAEIVKDSDTEANKVHYIYDYIVNTVVYDYTFTEEIYKDDNTTTGQLFSYRCLYMEGVFGLEERGVFDENSRTAICDGLSKAFLCMATIEGLETRKISGTVNDEGHAWNKVKVNGVWYLVDTTWGNTLDSASHVEYLNHEYLLVPDDNRHKETPYVSYPQANYRYNFGGTINNDPNGGSISPWTFGWRKHPRYAA